MSLQVLDFFHTAQWQSSTKPFAFAVAKFSVNDPFPPEKN